MKRTLLSLLLLTVILSGCTTYQIDSKDTSQDFYPPKKSIDEVQYLETVDKPYVEIGEVTVTTERRQSLEDVLPKLKQEAAVLGGDIITEVRTNASGIWKNVNAQKIFGNAYIRAKYSAKVLVLK